MENREGCLAHCPTCGPHLTKPFNASFSRCTTCRMIYRIRLFPCTCVESIPEDMDQRLYPLDELSALRAEIASSDLSKLRKRVLLLVSLVPEGRYTTVTAIKSCMNQNFQATGNAQIVGALEKNLWDDVPVHRVINYGGGTCLSSNPVPAVDEEESRLLLAEEGVRFDKNGRALGSAFRFF